VAEAFRPTYVPGMNAFTATCALLFAALVATPAMAENQNLPGVSQPEPIVTTPPPEPTDTGADPRSFRVGNTDVRLSGQIMIDITAGDLKVEPRR
jgi:hypothetical protein